MAVSLKKTIKLALKSEFGDDLALRVCRIERGGSYMFTIVPTRFVVEIDHEQELSETQVARIIEILKANQPYQTLKMAEYQPHKNTLVIISDY